MSNRLKLGALSTAKAEIEDRDGKVWTLDPGVRMRTAVALLELSEAQEEDGGLRASQIRQLAESMARVFQKTMPEVTGDDLLDAFSLDDLLEIVAFLSSLAATATEELAAMGQEDSLTPTSTPKRKK